MPNHVTTRATISGPEKEVARFVARCLVADGDDDLRFDFNTLIPMPEVLRDTVSGTSTDYGLMILAGRGDQRAASALSRGWSHMFLSPPSEMLRWSWVVAGGATTESELYDLLERRDPDCIKCAQAALDAYDQTGYTDWYNWSCDMWGTKWNSYDLVVDRREHGLIEFRFDTAWSTPEPVWVEFASEFPKLRLKYVAFDEGWNFAARGQAHKGTFSEYTVNADALIYEEVYGHEPPPDEEDE